MNNDFIKKISSDRKNLDLLNSVDNWIPSSENTRRSEEDQKKYESKMLQINEWYISFKDYILCEIFDFDCEMNTNGKLYAIYPEFDFMEYKLKINNYPYYLPNNTKHYVMWYLEKELDEKVINENILDEILNLEINCKKVVWYENPKIHSDIYHIHVFLYVI